MFEALQADHVGVARPLQAQHDDARPLLRAPPQVGQGGLRLLEQERADLGSPGSNLMRG